MGWRNAPAQHGNGSGCTGALVAILAGLAFGGIVIGALIALAHIIY